MDQNFSLMAQSRANYYTAGSPVQFVRVELLKGDTTGEVAVCLTFKNVGTEPLTGLVVHFKCKDAAGQVLCEDDFYYEQLNAQPGAVFGSDDAVYVSDTPVSSVEVEQDRAFLNGRGVDLRNYKRVRLNMPRVLPGSIAKTLQQRTGNVQLTCVPQDTEYGWFCACGAFHPNEENTTVCSECGGDRAGIKATLTAILEEARQAAERQQQEVNAVASSVAPAPAPAPQPQAQPAPAASDPRAMANAVQAARDLIGRIIELTAGVQNRHDDLERRDLFNRVLVDGDTAPVVDDRDGVVGVDRHLDLGAETGHGLVDGVVNDLPHQVMQTAGARRADIHARALTNGLETFENLNLAAIVIVFVCHTSSFSQENVYSLTSLS